MSTTKHNGRNTKVADRVSFAKYLLESTGIVPLFGNNDGPDCTEFFQKTIDKKMHNFQEVIEKIGGKLRYIKSGSGGHIFQGIIPNSDDSTKFTSYAVKIVGYNIEDDNTDIVNVTRPENVEINILKILSQFVINNHTPHIVLPFATFNTPINIFITLGTKINGEEKRICNKRYDAFVKLYESGKLHKNVSVLISEWANGGDLTEYLKLNMKKMTLKEWKILLFQIISVLAVIQLRYPSFRHNDAKPNNWLIQYIHGEDKEMSATYAKYDIDGTIFYLPGIGYHIKLWDFDFACIKNVSENSKVNSRWANKMYISNKPNKYYDICYFICSLQGPGFFEDFQNISEVPSEVKQFFNDIVPQSLLKSKYINARGRLLHDLEYTTPMEILTTHPFFSKFIPYSNRKKLEFTPSGCEQLHKLLADTIDDNIIGQLTGAGP